MSEKSFPSIEAIVNADFNKFCPDYSALMWVAMHD